jgi:hypothetical protein
MVRFTKPVHSGKRGAASVSQRSPSRPPPPNYLRRSNQWRLLVLVASFMLVLVLIEEARKPKYYRWMWGETLEPRKEETSFRQATPSGSPARSPDFTNDLKKLPIGAMDAWSYAVDQLTVEETNGLHRLLRSVRNRTPLSMADSSPEIAAIDRIETAWREYLEHARVAIESQEMDFPGLRQSDNEPASEDTLRLEAETPTSRERNPLNDAASKKSEDTLRIKEEAPTSVDAFPPTSPSQLWEELSWYWEKVGDPAMNQLREFAQQPSESDETFQGRETLRGATNPLERVVDQRSLARVRDNTPFIPVETEAWFRLIERLRNGEVTPVSEGQERVSYLQLLDQPDIYRGQFVRVRGEVRRGYRVDAPENDSGIDHYYVLWLKPDDGTNAPITLYALSLPPEFPPLADRTATGGVTDLTESIDAGGAFFKRWAYRGERNLEIAPLLVISEITWYPEQSEFQTPIARSDLLTAILGGILLGLAGLWFAWRTLHPPSSGESSRNPSAGPRSAEAPRTGKIPPTLRIGIVMALSGIWGFAPCAPGALFASDTDDSAPPLPWSRPDRPSGPSELPDILQLFGIISSDLETLASPETSPSQRERLLLNLLFYLPRLTPEDWSRWRETQPSLEALANEPSLFRGRSVVLRGRAREIQVRSVPRDLGETLEFSRYWEVKVQLTDEQQEAWGEATLFSRHIPAAWEEFAAGSLDEPTEIRGAFLDATRDPEGNRKLVAATARLPWYPDRLPDRSHPAAALVHPVSLQLAGAGVDHALWDDVRRRNGRPLEGPDRELFYQILAALTQRDSVAMGERHGRALELGPLLLSPTDFQGELLTLTAFARRITRVRVADADIRQRFGITHYYHIDALINLENQQIRLESRTPGRAAVYSDKFPMTFCTVQLPADLMELAEQDSGGGSPRPLINERIDISGIFLKTWPFRSEFLLGIDPDQRHPSPLLLGTRPVSAPLAPLSRDTPLELLFAILFVLILTGGAVWVWKKDRSPKGT